MPPSTPYSKYLGDRDAITTIGDSIARVRAITAAWRPSDYERTYAPGKWTARQILIHLAESEMALGTRARMALTVAGYTAQTFDQDGWLARESTIPADEARDAFLALAAMNRSLFAALPPADRQKTMTHPEYGSISVDWVIHTIAGHQINHLLQLEQIAGK